MPQAIIHLARINNSVRHFQDGFIEDNGKRLRTLTILPDQISAHWSDEWQAEGRIPFGKAIGSVKKYLFYDQFFSIMEIHSTTDHLLGYYVDLSTPVRKEGDEYFLEDLILDLWIYPDQTYQILDEDEWQQAISDGLIPMDLQKKIKKTLQRLLREITSGKFPRQYIQDDY